MAINSTDLSVRLQLAGGCIGSKTHQLAKQLKYTGQCIDKDFKELRLLIKYVEILQCYQIDSEFNCLEEEDIIQIFEQISKLCNITFQPLGYNYEHNTIEGNFRITTQGNTRSTDTGDLRIII